MQLHFDPDLDHQLAAIDAVCDLFRGQETSRPVLLGAGNRLRLSDAALHRNLVAVQRRNGLTPSGALVSGDFTVEMETGTGKTYVYLRTVFELNQRYGFTKFVVVVPSVAIREGVDRSIEAMTPHFRALYGGVPFGSFLYESAHLGRVRGFAASPHIQIMIVTVGAINKHDINNLYKPNERTGGERPIDLIRAVRPILIVDEPQSVDGGLSGAGKQALEAMHPLCTLRYSATHVDEHHRVFRLDAAEAYERRLVKRVEVASATLEDAHERPYARLIAVRGERGHIEAQVELDVRTPAGVRRRAVWLRDGDDLEQATARELYRSCRLGEIRAGQAGESLRLHTHAGEHVLRIGEVWGEADPLALPRQMIRRTLEEHLEKEARLRPRGIKVLSLFFIDAVERYRSHDAAGRPVAGPYARLFEEEYRRLAAHPQYGALFEQAGLPHAAEEVHGGYFSIDRRGAWADTTERNQAGRDAAERAYALIMREKEALLRFETPLRFIFSHSALREGWDNPNVFQICTLRDIRSERERRQTIGRGLRLCVDQRGVRVRGFDVNTLTVIANESYESFAAGLQKELAAAEPGAAARFEVTDADARRRARSQRTERAKDATASQENERESGRPAPRVDFDPEALIAEAIRALRAAPPISAPRLQWRTAGLAIGAAGVTATERARTAAIGLATEASVELPDVLAALQARTRLTRRSLARILIGSGRLDEFRSSPQRFIEVAAEVIDRCTRSALDAGAGQPACPDATPVRSAS